MKRMRRLSIELRRREVTITVQGSTFHVQDADLDTVPPSPGCPACGSPWFTAVAPADRGFHSGIHQIHRVLQQSGLHAQVSPAGQLRICERSIEKLKEIF